MQAMIEQARAHFCLEEVLAVKDNAAISNDEFKAYTRQLPALIQKNGLGQALALCKSKKELAWGRLYQVVGKWLTRQDQLLAGQTDLMSAVLALNLQKYQMATAQTQALLLWLKKFSQSELMQEKSDVQ